MTALLHYPPLACVSRFLRTPPAAVSPELRHLSDRSALPIGPELDRLFERILVEPSASLPLLAPTAIQLSAIAVSLAGQRFLPFPSAADALQQLVGLIEHRVLDHGFKDRDFEDRTPEGHLQEALAHFSQVRDHLTVPSATPQELHSTRIQLADCCAYLTFAAYSRLPNSPYAP